MLARRFVYNAWANREAARSVRDAGDRAPARALEVMAHVVAAERLWLGRLGQAGGDASHPVWPTLSIDEIDAGLDGLARAWPAALARLDGGAIDRPFAYTNLRGESWSSTPGEIFEHLLLHAHYHRGQVATLLGRSGLRAAVTDFIHWARVVEPGGG